MFEKILNITKKGTDKDFIKTPDTTPERHTFNLEYQKDFASFFKKVLSEAGIEYDLNIDLKKYEDFVNGQYKSKPAGVGSAYIDASSSLREVFSWENHQEEVNSAHRKKGNLDVLQSYLEREDVDIAKKNIIILIMQNIDPDSVKYDDDKAHLSSSDRMPAKVNDCVMAEKNMLAYVSGKHTKPKDGFVSVVVNDKGEPVMLEKTGLGESNSCITLAPVFLDGKYVPAGALMQSLDFSDEKFHFERKAIREKLRWFSKKEGGVNFVKTLDEYEGFKFIRFSILSVPPEIRSDACGGHFLHQQDKTDGYINYDWLTPEILSEYALGRIKK